jgi:phosphatidylglycerol:prolipoprotein diacylglycerol transferase
MSGLFTATYVVPAVLALVLALLYPVSRHLGAGDRRRYHVLQAITLVGAIVGAKIAALMGDHQWPLVPLSSGADLVTGGRSIVGGLLGGFFAAEIAKPLLGYTLPPNDRFAAILPFSLAIGRVGCFLSGCCRGTPFDGWPSIAYADGIARHPAPLYEAAFQVAIGLVFVALVRRRILEGRLFAVYLVAYGAYRFASEFVRETPHVLFGYSVYQALCVVMIVAGGTTLVLRSKGAHVHAPAA